MKIIFRASLQIIILAILATSVVRCGPAEHDLSSSQSGELSLSEDPALKADALAVLEKNQCLRCHQNESRGGIYNISNPSDLLRQNLFDIGKASTSRLIKSIVSGQMPKENPDLPQNEIDVLINWLDSIQYIEIANDGGDGSNSTDRVTFTQIKTQIFQPQCLSCHSAGANSPNLNNYYDTILLTNRLTPNDSRLLKVVTVGQAPASHLKMSESDLNLMQQWITDGLFE